MFQQFFEIKMFTPSPKYTLPSTVGLYDTLN